MTRGKYNGVLNLKTLTFGGAFVGVIAMKRNLMEGAVARGKFRGVLNLKALAFGKVVFTRVKCLNVMANGKGAM